MTQITIKNALRKCGHKEDYTATTGGTENTVHRYALSENCTACKIIYNKEQKRLQNHAINKAKAIMESKGFVDCSFDSINEGKKVIVTLYIDI